MISASVITSSMLRLLPTYGQPDRQQEGEVGVRIGGAGKVSTGSSLLCSHGYLPKPFATTQSLTSPSPCVQSVGQPIPHYLRHAEPSVTLHGPPDHQAVPADAESAQRMSVVSASARTMQRVIKPQSQRMQSVSACKLHQAMQAVSAYATYAAYPLRVRIGSDTLETSCTTPFLAPASHALSNACLPQPPVPTPWLHHFGGTQPPGWPSHCAAAPTPRTSVQRC